MGELEFHYLINLFVWISLPNPIRYGNAGILREKCVFTGGGVLADCIGAEVGVRLIPCDPVPHRIYGVIERIDGFIQLLSVLVFFPFIVS